MSHLKRYKESLKKIAELQKKYTEMNNIANEWRIEALRLNTILKKAMCTHCRQN